MLYQVNIAAQNSFGLSGFWGAAQKKTSILNNLENSSSNYSYLKDWGISINYGEEFSASAASNLYSMGLSKRIGSNIFLIRYTPGYQKEFTFSNPISVVTDSINKNESLNSSFSYKELFGFGYSYIFSKDLSAGFTLRFFNQEYNQDVLNSIFKPDTVYLDQSSNEEKVNSLIGDLNFNYSLGSNLSFSISSANLFDFTSGNFSNDFEPYKLRLNKAACFGFSYFPSDNLGFNFLYETTTSFQSSINLDRIWLDDLGVGISIFHDKYQTPFIAGIVPSITYLTKNIGITISGVKYFSRRRISGSFSEFEKNGIHSIINNRYSFDKAVVTFSFTLNTLPEKEIEFLGVDIKQDIYPSLSENYIDNPFAVGKVVNLTDKTISVKPECRIEGINNEKIQSPLIKIGAKDTAEVPFFILIPDSYSKNKPEISYADFFIYTVNNEPDAQLQKPALVNGINSWDGKVINLRHFIDRDINYAMAYSKNVLSNFKSELDTIPYRLSIFYKAKLIFNEFIKKMVYSSDPRASADYVQFPHETVKLKGGDCDDLSVLYSSFLESIGIQTALVDYKPGPGIGHVNVMFNTQLSPDQAGLITKNDNKYFIRKNEKGISQVWIVIETTSLTDFDTAWNIGMEKFNNDAINSLGLAIGTVNIVDIN